MRHVPIVELKPRYPFSPLDPDRYTVGTVFKNTVTVVVAIVEDLVVNVRCLTQYAPTVKKKPRFLSSLAVTNQFTALTASSSNAVKL